MNTVIKAGDKAVERPESKFEDELIAFAEQLIVKGREQGYLTPGDILQGFPEIDAEPDQIFTIFGAFKDLGIEVTDGEKDYVEVEQIDDEMMLDVEMIDSVSLDDPVRMYLREIGRVSLLSANDVIVLAQAIEAKPLHDALRALNVAEEVDGRQRNLDEMLPDIIDGLALVKRKGRQAHIAQELLGLADLSRLQSLLDAAAAERRRQASGVALSGPTAEVSDSLWHRPLPADRALRARPRGQAAPDRGQPAAGRLDCQEVCRPRHVLPRSDPRRQHRPDPRGREV